MESELRTYRDLDTLRLTAEEKKKVTQAVPQRCATVSQTEKAGAAICCPQLCATCNCLNIFIYSQRYQSHQLPADSLLMNLNCRLTKYMSPWCRDYRRSACLWLSAKSHSNSCWKRWTRSMKRWRPSCKKTRPTLRLEPLHCAPKDISAEAQICRSCIFLSSHNSFYKLICVISVSKYNHW